MNLSRKKCSRHSSQSPLLSHFSSLQEAADEAQGHRAIEVLFSCDDLEKLTNVQLKEILRGLRLKVSGNKSVLVERLVEHKAEIQRVRSGKRKLPAALKLADPATDVFIPLDETVQQLEALLQEKRVVFLRAGVASGKSTLAQFLCREQPSKYLQVFAPNVENVTFQNWQIKLMATLGCNVEEDLQDAIKKIYDNDQVLVFDECHLLFSCPNFLSMFLKPGYLQQPPMMLLLSAASEAVDMREKISQTPAEITGKYMWTPPMPHPNALVHQLAEADVYLSEDAIEFFMKFCGGHRGIFIRAMEWVQMKQRGTNTNCKQWTVAQAYGQVKLAWARGDWTDRKSFLGTLATVRAIRVNGHYGDLANIPQKFLEILCGGATSDLELEDRRTLTIHGFLLPVGESAEEFAQYDWSAEGTNYGVSTHLLASYYRCVLEKKRKFEVNVNMNPSSGIDLLLRALPYLHFSTVVGSVIVQNDRAQATFSAQGLPAEVHYTGAIIQILERLGFSAGSVETGKEGKVDIYVVQDASSTFAIEAVMASRRAAEIEEHRKRFDNVSMTNYADAKHKCLLIIGRQDSTMRKLVRDTRGGIEIVGLAANSAHTGYHVYVKQQEQQGKEVLDFYIPCDGVARSLSFKEEESFFEISSAQKFQSIQPGWISFVHSNMFKRTALCFEKCQNV